MAVGNSLARRLRSAVGHLARGALSGAAAGTGLYELARRSFGGLGVIFTLHRVVEPGRPVLWPGYAIEASQLDAMLGRIRRMGWEIVALDQLPERLRAGGPGRFVCLTLDDGYRDNLRVAAPVFRKHEAPFCVNVSTGLVDRTAFYWWGALEDLVLARTEVEVPGRDRLGTPLLPAGTLEEKRLAYDALNDACAAMPPDQVRDFLADQRIDWQASLDRDFLTAAETRELAAEPLATVGGHGATHQRLAPLPEEALRHELEYSRRVLERWTERAVRHMAYPFGDAAACGQREFEFARRAGWATAATTRRGNVFAEHRDHLTTLPRREIPTSLVGLRNALSGLESVVRGWPRFQAG